MESRQIVVSTLVLRQIVLGLLIASIAVFATTKLDYGDGPKLIFTFAISYRYVLASACIGFIYTLVQIPFAIYHSCTEKRMIRNRCLTEFDFYGDKVVALVLATGCGAGFALTYEFKKAAEGSGEIEKGLNKVYVAVGLLSIGFLCTAILSVISSITKASSSKRGYFS